MIVQINDCRHVDRVDASLTKYVVMTNGEFVVAERLMDSLYPLRDRLKAAKVIFARNRVLMYAKKAMLKCMGSVDAGTFVHVPAPEEFARLWNVEEVSFEMSIELEMKLRRLGMRLGDMPSTGLIAYEWLRHNMAPQDSLQLAGFTFQGWDHHPWAIEKQIVVPVNVPEMADAGL